MLYWTIIFLIAFIILYYSTLCHNCYQQEPAGDISSQSGQQETAGASINQQEPSAARAARTAIDFPKIHQNPGHANHHWERRLDLEACRTHGFLSGARAAVMTLSLENFT